MFRIWLESKELGLSSVTENGILFKTNFPVTFEYMRNTVSSPDLGKTFGQDIEPSGRYILHNTHSTLSKEKDHLHSIGWETGLITFSNPLVISLSFDEKIYGEKGWKQRLYNYYGKKGKDLTKKLREDGYDGIVTTSNNETREIVDLTFGSKIHESIDYSVDDLENKLKEKYPELTKIIIFENKNFIEISSIEVAAKHQNKGIGTKVIEEIKKYSKKVNKPIILLSESKFKKDASLNKFYKNLGFKKPGGKKDFSLPRHTHIYHP